MSFFFSCLIFYGSFFLCCQPSQVSAVFIFSASLGACVPFASTSFYCALSIGNDNLSFRISVTRLMVWDESSTGSAMCREWQSERGSEADKAAEEHGSVWLCWHTQDNGQQAGGSSVLSGGALVGVCLCCWRSAWIAVHSGVVLIVALGGCQNDEGASTAGDQARKSCTG